jgi:hypothetical protein
MRQIRSTFVSRLFCGRMRRRVTAVLALCAALATLLVSAAGSHHHVDDGTRFSASPVVNAAPVARAVTKAKRATASIRDGARPTPWLAAALALLALLIVTGSARSRSRDVRLLALRVGPARAPPAS